MHQPTMDHGRHRRPTAIMVPHPRRQGIQQSTDMLQNRSTSLKLEKKILITINLTIMCMTRQRWWCGCRGRCPQPHMGRLRRFRRNRSVLWACWYCPVARLPQRRRRGRQSEHGRRGGHLGGSATADFLRRWAPLDAVAEFGAPTVTLRSHGCCRWEGARVLVGSERGGRIIVHGDGGDRDTGLTPIFRSGMFDALFLC